VPDELPEEPKLPARRYATAAALAAKLAGRPDLFHNVRRPDAGPFFEREGLLFQPAAEVKALQSAPGAALKTSTAPCAATG